MKYDDRGGEKLAYFSLLLFFCDESCFSCDHMLLERAKSKSIIHILSFLVIQYVNLRKIIIT